MFNNIHHMPYSNACGNAQTTVALVDGPDVRYVVAFFAGNDVGVCSVTCSVVHAGSSHPVGFSVTDHR